MKTESRSRYGRRIASAFGALLAVLALHGAALAQSAKRPFRVVTTFTVIQDIAQNVAGDKAIVESITKPGAEIHDYQPTPLDIVRAQAADLVLWNGFNLERWFEKFFENAKEAPSVVLTEGIEPMGIREGPYSGKPNPHAWMSPTNALAYVENIRKAFIKYDPSNAETYNRNAAAYAAQIKALDEPLRQRLAAIPEDQRWLVTSEGAFSYLARDYGMREAYLWPINADYPFMQRALIVALLVGAVCAVLSCFLVLKGWSLMGDAISHAVLPGIVIAYVIGLPLAVGAFAAGLSCALLTGYLKEHSRVKEDTVNHILFGNVLGVSARDLIETAVIAGTTLLIVLVKRRDFLLYCFDPSHARVVGLPVRALHYGLLILLSLTIVASLKAVGIILVIAMLVAPGAIAYLLTDSFERILIIATAVATGSSAIGTILSFHIDAATGACIVLIQAFIFVLVFLLAPRCGVLMRARSDAGTTP